MDAELLKRARKLLAEGLERRIIADRLGVSLATIRDAADPKTQASVPRGYQVHANRIGISVEEYIRRREAGERWCLYCPSTDGEDGRLGAWHPQSDMEHRGQVCKACVIRDPSLKKRRPVSSVGRAPAL